jgi:hypothetical protein
MRESQNRVYAEIAEFIQCSSSTLRYKAVMLKCSRNAEIDYIMPYIFRRGHASGHHLCHLVIFCCGRGASAPSDNLDAAFDASLDLIILPEMQRAVIGARYKQHVPSF